ncbi:CDP-alcohol phosphatidyltransferase family protein [Salinadaptatus halalkaliphilus]|uniref:CDP-alcohol phosphatidyltransferase family protein n=1 Tax=Salinadaptatus halalkaliphilus TaxID=2419781 RepID=A0A4S3TRM3_9EURY|nr:CDP-alcohol phosphatidyltransferase family protein [Salinadaptatus halalkaliphilus]THE65258.1 CDP-alcohol phosphatidyltransferase family protein [Salinadaptatus halalkaliphilus]
MTDDTTGFENRPRWRYLSHLAVGSTLLVGVGVVALAVVWSGGPSTAFLVGVAITFALTLLVVVWVCSQSPAGALKRSVSGATWITIARASGVAILGGFLVGGVPTAGSVRQLDGWLPGILFALVAVLDAVDGPVARGTDSVTRLGGRLDTEIDGLTVLVGTVLVVANGLAPRFFLVAGLARYAFVAAVAVWHARGRTVLELDENRVRGVLGALVLCVVWIALLPVAGPSTTRLLATIVLLPFLANFLRDWLVVTGRYHPQ